MAFTYSSGIITHSGTDTDLSGLVGLTGVTVSLIGNITLYQLVPRLLLSSDSILNHNPDKEVLILTSAAGLNPAPLVIPSGAVYNYGAKTIVGSSVSYSTGSGIICTAEGTSSLNIASVLVLSGGTLNWNGGNILTSASLVLRSGAIVNQFSGTFINLSNNYTYQLRVESTSPTTDALINFNDVTLDSYGTVESRFLTTSGFNVGVFTFKKASFQTFLNYQPPLLLLNFNNYNVISSADIIFNSSLPSYASTLTLRNCAKEVNIIQNIPDERSGYAKIEKSISLNFLNTDDTDAGEVVVYGKDFDNGSRFTGAQGQDDTADKIYSASQNSPVNFNVLRNIVNISHVRATQRYDDDRTNVSGQIPLIAFSYKSIFTTVNYPLLGLDTFSQTYYLPDDNLVTESDKTIVDAYTSIDNARQLYDRSKAYIFDERMTFYITTREGNNLIASPYDIVFDANAVDVFAFDGTTITVKSSEYISDITTSGLVTALNGAIITGNISDENGDSNVTVTTPAGYEDDVAIYPTLTDAEDETNQIGSGLKFRYLNSVYGGTNIWYRMTAIDGSYIIENYLVPALAGNYEVSLVVTSENAALGAIKAVTDKLDAMIEVIGGEQAFKTTALQNVTPTDLTGVAKQSTVLGLY